MNEVKTKQNIASDPNKSIWVGASAGSGKTTVLVKRLLRMFLQGIEPSKILCITFTNTGAIQMKNRVNEKLAQWSMLSDDKLKDEIIELEGDSVNIEKKVKVARTLFAKILDCSNDFKILTIHSFCQQIIKRFPLEANIIPNFQIADDIVAQELLFKAKDELLKYDNLELKKAIEYVFTYKNEDQFLDLLKKAIEKKDDFLYLQNKFNSTNGVIEEIAKIFKVKSDWTFEELKKDFLNNIDLSFYSDDILEIIEGCGGVSDLEFVNFFRKDFDLDKYISLFLKKNDNAIKVRILTKKVFEKIPELAEILDNEAKRVFDYKQKVLNFANFKFTANFLKILYSIFDIYSALKKDAGYLDYSDLIIETDKLLNNNKYKNTDGENYYSSWINYKLDEGIDHLLIDEAQDTSLIQWDIVKSITEEFFSGYGSKENLSRTIFVVGDEKQSIFSFQGADPEAFDLTLKNYEKKINECGKFFEVINLNTSFRSVKSVLNVVDKVFEEPSRQKSISKMPEKIIHNIVRKDCLGKVEVWPLINLEKKETDKVEPIANWDILAKYNEDIELTAKQKLAEIIAKKINSWFENGKVIYSRSDKKFRNLKYSDIMILVKRRDKDFINYLIRQFNKYNIPTMGNDRFKLAENIISQDIISLCKFLIFNNDDLSLANIIKSPILNLSEDDLYNLCDYKNTKNITLWQAFQELNINNSKEFLEDLLEKSKILTTYEFLFYLFETKKIRQKIKERFLYLADEVISEILNIANNYEKDHINSTLLSFIDFLENSNFEIKRDLDQSANEIKIITIHSSKGLESPIIILPDTNHTNAVINKTDNLMSYMEDGVDYKLPILQQEKSNFIENKVKLQIKEKSKNEYYRLLYVAMTRAENELYICDIENSSTPNEENWYSLIKRAVENMNPQKKTDINFKDTEILYIGEDDIFEKKEENAKNEKENLKVDEIIKILSKETKENNETKIINPSTYYSENTINKPYENSTNIENGKLVHKLLEILPDIDKKDWNNIIEIYLKDKTEKEKIKNIVLNILNNQEFSFLFENNSKAEVPIFGKIDNDIISGQIDRLTITDDKIYIVDYKNTNYLPNKVPEKYKKQLELYKTLIQKIYSDKTIQCYILWTSFGKIEKIM